jgi:hypothetical protein
MIFAVGVQRKSDVILRRRKFETVVRELAKHAVARKPPRKLY